MTDPGTGRNPNPQERGERASVSKTDINSTLHLLRQVHVPSGLEDRIEARLNAAKSPYSSANIHWPWNRIAASLLVVGLAGLGVATHRSGGTPAATPIPVAPIPLAAHHAASSGMEPANAIRVPTRAIGPVRLNEGRSARPTGIGRHTIERHVILPHGVAVPHHPAATDPSRGSAGLALQDSTIP
ncbi:MAG TPA: hypothetical protein VM554_00535 [Acidisarcina sp.]|nr:hypothetical protein [Acidisarcina sp.]